MRDHIVGKTAQVRARRLRRAFCCRDHFPSVIETPNESGQDAAGVRQCELKLWVTIQYSAKNQMASGNCGVHGKGNQIWERVWLQALATYGRRQGGEKNRQFARLHKS